MAAALSSLLMIGLLLSYGSPASATGVREHVEFIGCNSWPYPTSEGVLTFDDCQERAEEKGSVYFGLNWGNHKSRNHGGCQVQASRPSGSSGSACQDQTDDIGNYIGSTQNMAWYHIQKPVQDHVEFIGCKSWPYPTTEGVLTFDDCRKQADEKGSVYFGLNWGNHKSRNHGGCQVQASKPSGPSGSACQDQTDDIGNYIGSSQDMAWYHIQKPVQEYVEFVGCKSWPYPTTDGVLTFDDCQKQAEGKGSVYFGLNWGNHKSRNHGGCQVQASMPSGLSGNACQDQTDDIGNYLGSSQNMAWYHISQATRRLDMVGTVLV